MSNWILQDFEINDISCQLIEFVIEDQKYLMFFNRVDAFRSEDVIAEKAKELGISYSISSYEIKFDLKSNFESSHFFEKPDKDISIRGMRKLAQTIKELLEFHYQNSSAEVYFFVAENQKIKRFYDRLAKNHAQELDFIVKTNLGEEGLGYEIITPRCQKPN